MKVIDEIAAALIVAEIERLDCLSASVPSV